MNQHHIEQYVAGSMSEAEAEAFELYCLAKPEFARQVELEQRLKGGLAQVARGSTSEFVREESTNYWKYAAAASVVLMLGAAMFAWRYLPAPPAQILSAGIAGATHSGASMRLALVRGSGNTPRLPDGQVQVEIVGLFDADSSYSIALDHFGPNRNVDAVDAIANQRPTSPVTLEIIIDSGQLEAGTYSLRVRRQASNEETLEFHFVKP
jgi:hypothetical protein